MTDIKCPICNKVGIPDYRRQPTICPQCNSDLKPYLLIHYIASNATPGKKNSAMLILGLSCCCLVLSFSLYKTSKSKKEHDKLNKILHNSIDKYSENENDPQKNDNSKNRIENKKRILISYTIRKGDSPRKIEKLFYGDGHLYKKFEKEKQREKPYPFEVGQSLNIKLYPN
ncbi:MAG: hypothetical protein LBH32_09590 [Dysgonamonadaceae bacterium]|jgi:hypothetical protein|nr:hypothetical protein [Dysgonamonadaceae bacterium]